MTGSRPAEFALTVLTAQMGVFRRCVLSQPTPVRPPRPHPGGEAFTGCSSGIGHEAALRLHDVGFNVYATARRLESLADLAAAGITTLRLDVTDEESMAAAVGQVTTEHGGVAILVNNAGFELPGVVEELPLKSRAAPASERLEATQCHAAEAQAAVVRIQAASAKAFRRAAEAHDRVASVHWFRSREATAVVRRERPHRCIRDIDVCEF